MNKKIHKNSSKLKNLTNYHDTFFPRKEKGDIVNKYIEGFEWVLNYYFNIDCA